jgi:hypothetical protein
MSEGKIYLTCTGMPLSRWQNVFEGKIYLTSTGMPLSRWQNMFEGKIYLTCSQSETTALLHDMHLVLGLRFRVWGASIARRALGVCHAHCLQSQGSSSFYASFIGIRTLLILLIFLVRTRICSDRNPKPETRNPKPETRNPKPETRNPKPETQSNKPLYGFYGFCTGNRVRSFVQRRRLVTDSNR